MGFAITMSRACIGVDAPTVTIEVHLANGIPSFSLVGLAEKTVSEAKERVRSAIIQSGFEFPAKRIVVNLAPAELPKHGGRFDLAIAVAILAASGQVNLARLVSTEFIGELSLSGTLRSVPATLTAAIAAGQSLHTCIVPSESSEEVALCQSVDAYGAGNLCDVVSHLNDEKLLAKVTAEQVSHELMFDEDIADVIGQPHAKRALLIAAAGQHNLLFVGPPGTGKTLLAKRLLTLLPALNEQQALESASVASVANQLLNPTENWFKRPFRAPHHTASATAMVGGGASPKPGEISLAHNGVLFLDELPEFGRHILDTLREPLETGSVNISRALAKVNYPANFQLVAAMNPSPTGTLDNSRSSPDQILRYLNRLSGPLLDRIDLQILVGRQSLSDINSETNPEKQSPSIRAQVSQLHNVQTHRQNMLNAHLNGKDLQQHCKLSKSDSAFFVTALEQIGASHRAMHRFLRVARTIADIENSVVIERHHLAEAMGYRALDIMFRQLETS